MTKYDITMMETAILWSKMSHCKRSRVGCAIAKDSRIISIGYNGTPSGFMNHCEEDDTTLHSVLHAEQNALMFAAKSGISTDNTTLYCTLSPCAQCSLLIIQSGITRVVYANTYRNSDGLDLLRQANIEVIHLPMVNL